jgi:hypothetical protein
VSPSRPWPRTNGRDSLLLAAAISNDPLKRIATLSAAATRAVGVFIEGPVASLIVAVEWLETPSFG